MVWIVISTLPPPRTVDGVAVSQSWSALTDQLHELLLETVTLPFPPDATKLTHDGDTGGELGHGQGGGGPDWTTTTRRSPMVTTPVRTSPVDDQADAEIVTVPPPKTGDGVAVSQSRSSLTDQLQELLPDTVTLTLPPDAAKPTNGGDTDREHGGGGPIWTTPTLRPPICTVPQRVEPAFEDAEIATVPPPYTGDVDGNIVIQVWSALTDQLQELLPDTVTSRFPPDAAKLADDGDTAGASGHGPTWTTLTLTPPIRTVPQRSEPAFEDA